MHIIFNEFEAGLRKITHKLAVEYNELQTAHIEKMMEKLGTSNEKEIQDKIENLIKTDVKEFRRFFKDFKDVNYKYLINNVRVCIDRDKLNEEQLKLIDSDYYSDFWANQSLVELESKLSLFCSKIKY